MGNPKEKNADAGMGRRDLLKTGLLLAGSSLFPGIVKASSVNVVNDSASGYRTETLTDSEAQIITGRRKLGRTLEVSSIGLGVQNMSRTYQTTIPTRKEMHKIIQKHSIAVLHFSIQRKLMALLKAKRFLEKQQLLFGIKLLLKRNSDGTSTRKQVNACGIKQQTGAYKEGS